jgi:antitoxin HicB
LLVLLSSSSSPTLENLNYEWWSLSRAGQYSYTVLFEPAEEGGYVAFCPALPCLVSEGDTFEEARERVTEAIEAYLESLREDGLPIPPDKKIALEPAKEQIHIALPELA